MADECKQSSEGTLQRAGTKVPFPRERSDTRFYAPTDESTYQTSSRSIQPSLAPKYGRTDHAACGICTASICTGCRRCGLITAQGYSEVRNFTVYRHAHVPDGRRGEGGETRDRAGWSAGPRCEPTQRTKRRRIYGATSSHRKQRQPAHLIIAVGMKLNASR